MCIQENRKLKMLVCVCVCVKDDGSDPRVISIFPSIRHISLLSRRMYSLANFSSTQHPHKHTGDVYAQIHEVWLTSLLVGISMWTRFHMAFLFPKSTQISKSVTSLILPTITGGCSCHFHQGHWVEDPLIRPCYMPF